MRGSSSQDSAFWGCGDDCSGPPSFGRFSLAQFTIAYARGWAADSANTRVRLKAKLDRALQDNALLREEMRIKDVRMARSWMGRVDEEGPAALVQLPVPVNKFPDFVWSMVQRLKALCPTLGKSRLPRHLHGQGCTWVRPRSGKCSRRSLNTLRPLPALNPLTKGVSSRPNTQGMCGTRI